MLLQKTLHMSQCSQNPKPGLASIQSYRRQFLMATRATVSSSNMASLSVFAVRTVMRLAPSSLTVETDSPDQYTFDVRGREYQPMGIVVLSRQIRPTARLVKLAAHVQDQEQVVAWLDGAWHLLDSFVTAELTQLSARWKSGTTGCSHRGMRWNARPLPLKSVR